MKAPRRQSEPLRRWLETARADGGPGAAARLPEALEQIEAAVEELAVAEDELRAQNHELLDMHMRLEAEREYFQKFFDFAPDPYIVTDESGGIDAANPAAGALTGVSPERLIGKPLTIFIAPEHHAALFELLGSLDPAGAPRQWRAQLRRRDGAVVPVEITASRRGHGSTSSVQWLIRDISARLDADKAAAALVEERALRRALEATERSARFLIEASVQLGMALDVDEAAVRLARAAAAELGDAAYVDLVVPEGICRFSAVSDGIPERFTEIAAVTAVLQEGEPRLIAPLEEKHGADLGIVVSAVGSMALMLPLVAREHRIGVLTIISPPGGTLNADSYRARGLADRGALAIDNLKLLEDARAADRAKAEFISTMSHEFRTPLTSIAGYADLLDGEMVGPLNERQRSFVQSLRASAWHLAELVDQVLTFSRLDGGGEVPVSPVSLRPLIHEIVVLFSPDAQRRGIAISVESEDLVLHTDAARLRQILINLTANAMKFTDRGSITVRASREGEMAVLTVADTGPGIPPEHLERIFQPFWQVDQSDTRSRGGAGLGLAVCRRLVRLLGGSISVESTLGAGSTFRVELPLSRRPA